MKTPNQPNNNQNKLLFLLNFFDKNINFEYFSCFLYNNNLTKVAKEELDIYKTEELYINYLCEDKKYILSNMSGYLEDREDIYDELKTLKFENLKMINIGGLGFFGDDYLDDIKILKLPLFEGRSIKKITVEMDIFDLSIEKIELLKQFGVTKVILQISSKISFENGKIITKKLENKLKEFSFLLENNIKINIDYVSGYLFLDKLTFKDEVVYVKTIIEYLSSHNKQVSFEYAAWNISYNTIFIRDLITENKALSNKIFKLVENNYNDNSYLFDNFVLYCKSKFTLNNQDNCEVNNIYGIGNQVFSYLGAKIYFKDKGNYFLIDKKNQFNNGYKGDLLNLNSLENSDEIYGELYQKWLNLGLSELDLDYCSTRINKLYY